MTTCESQKKQSTSFQASKKRGIFSTLLPAVCFLLPDHILKCSAKISERSPRTAAFILSETRLKDEAVSAIFEACKIYPKLQLRLFSTDTAYGMGEMLQAFMNLASKTKFKKIKSKADLDRLNPFITNGILCANDLSVLAGAKEFLKDAPSLCLSSSSEHNIELIPSGRSKAAALKDVSQKYGIKPQNTIAFGNGENDLPMLIESGHGVAMANSPRHVLEQADVVTKSNNEDGIYAFLSKYFAEDLES